MKVVILAGGMGTRLSEESRMRPKPMVLIGGRPILWHIMKMYSSYGFYDFIICCGYKGHMIKQYFVDYFVQNNNVTFSLEDETNQLEHNLREPWKVTLVNTGLHTLTAGRLLKVKDYIENESFMLTYGDGVADININQVLEFHNQHKNIATISVTRPEGRFGAVKIQEQSKQVLSFREKARKDQSWVNIGFMVFQPEIFSYLGDGSEMLEASPFEKLAQEGKMVAYQQDGFWSPMDTVKDKEYLEALWDNGQAPWKVW